MNHPPGQRPHRRGPAQQVLDPGQQFAPVEWLADIIICPQFQPDDPVHVIGAPRQQDNPDLGLCPLFAGDFQPVLALQIDVHDQQVRAVLGQHPFGPFGTVAFGNTIAEGFQIPRQSDARNRFVLDDHDMGGAWYHHPSQVVGKPSFLLTIFHNLS